MKNRSFAAILCLIGLSGCTAADLREEIGIRRNAPDEFLVQPRAGLVVPTGEVALPSPTKKVSGHIAASEGAREAVFGTKAIKRENSALENQLLAKTADIKAEDDIRRTVNEEQRNKSGVFGTTRGGTMESILDPFGYNAPKELVVDAKKENKRIKAAIAKGEKVTAEGVRTKDPRKEKWEAKKDDEDEYSEKQKDDDENSSWF